MEQSAREFGTNRLTVLWEGVGLRDTFLKQRAMMQAKGWEFVEEREGPTPPEYIRFKLPMPTIFFTARRA